LEFEIKIIKFLNMKNKLGISSLAISFVVIFWLIINMQSSFIRFLNNLTHYNTNSFALVSYLLVLVLFILSLFLAIMSLVKKEDNKIFSILSIIVLLFIFFIMGYGVFIGIALGL